ncbi:cutinase family protein [Nocardia sp. NPDC058666]|uniref:cutinase family protein n=1 Tax=Nocardia sp. NPDC058666 TaxID=3346587 RepID=UPI003668B8B8
MNNNRPQRAWSAAAIAALSATALLVGSTPATAQPTKPPESACPGLHVFGVQGGEEGATTTVDTGDSGILGQAFGRMSSATDGFIARSYIVFGADTGSTDYPAAVSAAANQIEQTAGEVVARCPSTQIAVAGYAQGAAAVSAFAEKAGGGKALVPADRIAGIALLANPSRRSATTALPGTDNVSTPSAATGTDGTNVSKISLANSGLSGAGIAAAAMPTNYGDLVGRVADLCVAGDATCDVQSGSPLITAVANISAQSEGKDPVAAITTVAQALVSTAFTTAVGVVNDDISGTSLDQLAYAPAKTLGQRLAEASSPSATVATESDALSALFKIGTIGLNAVASVAQKVFTATTVAELATVGLANPWAAVASLGVKVAEAVVDLVPPQSVSTWVNDAFEAITSTVTDTQDLHTTAATAQYSDSTGRRSTYSNVAATTTGQSPLIATAAWFTALANDIATATTTSVTQTSSSTTTRAPTSATNPNPPTTPSLAPTTATSPHAVSSTPRP